MEKETRNKNRQNFTKPTRCCWVSMGFWGICKKVEDNTMKKRITILIFMFTNFQIFSQVIDFENLRLNCDTTRTTIEVRICSEYKLLEQSIAKYDSLFLKINQCLDILISEDLNYRNELKKEDSNQNFEFWTDYEKNQNYDESIRDKLFREYAETEMKIAGEFYDFATGRILGGNSRMQEIYDRRIKELIAFIIMHCS